MDGSTSTATLEMRPGLSSYTDALIVGTTSVEHLEEAIEALDMDFADSNVEYLEKSYEPKPVSGHE